MTTYLPMKNVTRKSLIAALERAHANTQVGETNTRFLIEAFIENLKDGFLNIHEAARTLREKGVQI